MKANKKVVVATGQGDINTAINSLNGYEVIGVIDSKDDLALRVGEMRPDILIVTDALRGDSPIPITTHILTVNMQNPHVRIIYLTNATAYDEVKMGALATLVSVGIYDIIYNKALTYDALQEIFDNPKDENDRDIEQLMTTCNKAIEKSNKDAKIEFYVPEDVIQEQLNDGSYKNVAVVSSIKPGTGKSFVSTNIATAIAAYGVDTPEGKRPRVGLIEADLQNLSIGTLLQIEDNKRNMKTAIEEISTIINKDDELVASPEEIMRVDEIVKSCFLPYKNITNLKALVGSQLGFKDVEWIKGVHFGYLVDSMIDHFDVIIIDSNSSLAHSTTYSLLSRAGTCFYVLNLDFNNVRNNVRYRDLLNEIGIGHRVKYVLNEDVTNPLGDEKEDLMFKVDHLSEEGFDFAGRIPLIPKTVFLNRLYMGTPIVLDTKEYTQPAKYELLKIANDVYPIKGFVDMDNNKNETKKKGLFSLFG